ncbi:helix-hairpin-helix domain-containing protein [Comamonas guangdongensis]|uniref:Helix-hairpin-helix domain-containing protein n=1 Tax=Comamonas guangdongensis TaxID=510515 RepID=A0ABV3ZVW1_9BURK
MPFTAQERQSLLAVKGIGPTVLKRLESLGYGSFNHLRQANALDIVAKAAALTGSSCWKNSPQARAAVQAAIDAARAQPGLKDDAPNA